MVTLIAALISFNFFLAGSSVSASEYHSTPDNQTEVPDNNVVVGDNMGM